MDKQAVIDRYFKLVAELDEEASDVVLSAGAALVMMDIRPETEDLDVDVNEGVFKLSASKRGGVLNDGINARVAFAGDVDLHVRDEFTGVVCIDGVWVYSPSALLSQKRYFMRHPGRKPEKLVQDGADAAVLQQLVHQQKFTARVVA